MWCEDGLRGESMDKEQTKQVILGFAEFFKGITGNQDLKIPNEIAEKYEIQTQAETKNYDSAEEFWHAHIEAIAKMRRHYKSLAISLEDYILYKSSAMAQVNSQLETVQLIGIIKHYCYYNNLEIFIRPAVAVKKRWSDDILLFKGIIEKIGARYIVPDSKQTICEHERDSIRHAVHFNIFENEEVSK